MYLTGKLRWVPQQQATLVLQPLGLKYLTPLYQQIPLFKNFRVLDYMFETDSSGCLAENNKQAPIKWFGDLRSIKRITSLTYSHHKKIWLYKLEERNPGIDSHMDSGGYIG